MKYSEATRVIDDAFIAVRKLGQPSSAALTGLSDETIIDAFEALERRGNGAFVGAHLHIQAFLFESYRRFTLDSYAAADPIGRLAAPRFLAAFALAVGNEHQDVYRLKVGTLIWSLAGQLGYKPGDGWPTCLPSHRAAIEQLSVEVANYPELAAETRKALAFLEGIRGDTGVQSVVEFELPHPLVRRETKIEFEYAALHVLLEIRPTAYQGLTSADMGVTPTGVSYRGGGAWPPGTSSVRVTTRGVLDWTASVEAYTSGIGPETGRSLATPFVAADVVRSGLIATATAAPDELDGQWLPVVHDIRQFTLSVGTEAEPGLYRWEHHQPGGVQVTVLDADRIAIDLGQVDRPQAWQAARTYARGALRSGRYFDAIVWANAGVESFIDAQLAAIRDMADVDSESLFEATSLYADAERIVREKHPELAGTIPWPEKEAAPSRFRQVKGAAKLVAMVGTPSQIQSAYSRVSNSRNDAVHGRTIDAVTPAQANEALENFDLFVVLFGFQQSDQSSAAE
ncbi:hypothetical protein NY547_03730 [Cnuibacter physcomitrellae]|uniref:hypothetical protein n=1 Tax=Cnuibacter physcomitrellae TaxID=1619308 RepID=UPI002175DE90|nr:hypothetical protein [Cnuibacter physcomitrellae]MCS5496347.1 hypothetical protein [Cnuibacter physcomitrellae]